MDGYRVQRSIAIRIGTVRTIGKFQGEFAVGRDAIQARFAGRILPVSDAVVRRWGALSGRIRRGVGHPPSVVETVLRSPPQLR
jgi:hypothetical protein